MSSTEYGWKRSAPVGSAAVCHQRTHADVMLGLLLPGPPDWITPNGPVNTARPISWTFTLQALISGTFDLALKIQYLFLLGMGSVFTVLLCLSVYLSIGSVIINFGVKMYIDNSKEEIKKEIEENLNHFVGHSY